MKYYMIINHPLSEAQLRGIDGEIITPSEKIKEGLLQSPDNTAGLVALAISVILEAKTSEATTILAPGGSPALMALISIMAEERGIYLWFSHSIREFSETVQPDGSVVKTNVFKHIRWLKI